MSLLCARGLWVLPPGGAGPPVVRGFSLEVKRGEWVALTGPNGGGKTSLALALAGLVPVERGTVIFDGEPLDPRSDVSRRGGVAVVLQDVDAQLLQPTVAEEIAFTALNLGRGLDPVALLAHRWSETLGLSGFVARDPRSLSAGERQLVLFAAALVAQPKLLVADELGAHLDRHARRRMLAALRAEVRRGLAVVSVSQEPEECAAADRTLAIGAAREGVESVAGVAAGGRSADEPERASGLFGADARERSPEEFAEFPAGDASAGPVLEIAIHPVSGNAGPRIAAPVSRTFEISGRGVIAILGRNGCGKSVLLEAMAGLRTLPGVVVKWLSPREPGPILAGQYSERQIFEERVADEIAFAATSRGLPRGRVLERARVQLENLGLSGREFLERRTWGLSSGEKRITQLLAALFAPASLVLLDEPTCGLDSERRAGLADLVRERGRETPVVIATQDPDWARSVRARGIPLDDSDPAQWQISAKKRIDRTL